MTKFLKLSKLPLSSSPRARNALRNKRLNRSEWQSEHESYREQSETQRSAVFISKTGVARSQNRGARGLRAREIPIKWLIMQ